MKYTDLFNQITALLDPKRQPVKIEGWCTPEKAFDLAAAVLTIRPKVTVEAGVFGGASLLPIAMALRAVSEGQIIGIDPWDKNESVKGMTGADLDWWGRLDHEAIYRGFMDAVLAEGLSNQVVVLRQTTDAVKNIPEVIDFLHIDGNHGEQSIRDAKRYGSKVRVGGLCFMDDLGWAGGAVGRAAEWLIESGFIKLYDRDTGAMFERVSMPAAKPRKPSANLRR